MQQVASWQVIALRVFTIITGQWVLSALIFGAACFLTFIVGGPLIRWLKSLRGMKWSPREDTPDSHLTKAGTPSMGGLGIIGVGVFTYIAIIALILVWGNAVRPAPSSRPIPLALWVALALMPLIALFHMLLGLIDDRSKAKGRGGLRSMLKLADQIVLAVGFIAILPFLIPAARNTREFTASQPLPFEHNLFVLPLLIAAFIVVATSNAVNLTDGIDGLAAGLCVQCGLAFYFCSISIDELGGIAVLFWAALAGACLGFLWFNKHPAKVFMGDTGSLALGACLGATVILCRAVFLLPFIGFIFWVEMLSVILQVAYFKYTKRQTGEGIRLFRRAPLHHHFELAGWREWRVVLVFWAVNAVTSIIGLALWYFGYLPHWP